VLRPPRTPSLGFGHALIFNKDLLPAESQAEQNGAGAAPGRALSGETWRGKTSLAHPMGATVPLRSRLDPPRARTPDRKVPCVTLSLPALVARGQLSPAASLRLLQLCPQLFTLATARLRVASAAPCALCCGRDPGCHAAGCQGTVTPRPRVPRSAVMGDGHTETRGTTLRGAGERSHRDPGCQGMVTSKTRVPCSAVMGDSHTGTWCARGRPH